MGVFAGSARRLSFLPFSRSQSARSAAIYPLGFVVIRECPVNVAALTIFAQSVFGVAIAALWLGGELQWGQVLGSIALLAGLGLGVSCVVRGISRQSRRPKRAGKAGTQV